MTPHRRAAKTTLKATGGTTTRNDDGDAWHDDGDGRHDDRQRDDGKGQHNDGYHNDGNRRHDGGDGRHDNCKTYCSCKLFMHIC